MNRVNPLESSELYQFSDMEQFGFESTDELEEIREAIGQPRAIEALKFGMGIDQQGYNIYAMGPPGTGKRSLLKQHFEKMASEGEVPPDWVYVYNFEDQTKPKAISLEAGRGSEFKQDMDEFTEDVESALKSSFESEEYRSRRESIEQEAQEEQEEALEELQKEAREKGFALIRTPGGLVFAPVRDGEVISPEELQQLSEEEQEKMQEDLEGLQEKLRDIMQGVPDVQRNVRERIRDLNRELAGYAIGGLIDDLKEKYQDNETIVEHLDAIHEDIVENANEFLAAEKQQQGGAQQAIMQAITGRGGRGGPSTEQLMKRYKANLLVDNKDLEGAPVIIEDNPTHQNLIGRVEHMAQMGALLTDFSLIRPGSLHKANGGYLILDVRQVLLQPYAYESLKRALESGEIKIESLGQMLSVISTVSLEPEPIPLNVKIAFYGDRMIYYLLSQFDPDFGELFRVQVDFSEQMDRDSDNQRRYARMIATLVHENDLKAFDKSAVARIVEHSSRMVGDSEKLTTKVRDVADLLRESHYWSIQNGNGRVTREDVQKAIDMKIYRADRLRERIQETILRDIFLIDTEGEHVGQVNGLSVLMLGDFMFGRPSRITARARMGKGEVVDIEREVDLSGPIHSKGVLILAGFLGARYATDKPLSLSASLVFEQSYSGVDGDSASSTELYALLSAIANVPLKQSFAVTGSVNQHGKVQAIGGVNEKIEGFFDICKSRGLTGDQGVLIPKANKKHLMLRDDVINAVKEGQFHIYALDNIDQGIELLTGMDAGELDEEGKYPPDTFNGRVQEQLSKWAEKRRELSPAGAQEEA